MNHRQKAALELLRSDSRRDIYEAGNRTTNFKTGNGQYFVTYLRHHQMEPLTRAEVTELVEHGYLTRKWEGVECYVPNRERGLNEPTNCA